MSRTIIFLDFDGVLNGPGDHLDAPCMDVFGRMLEMAPTAEIVVSSTWRLWRLLPELAAMFRPFGLDVTFAGATPVAHSQKPFSVAAYVNGALKVLDGSWGRYAEIRAWMHRAGVGAGDTVIVLDDLLMQTPLQPHAIKTASRFGLQPEDAARFRVLLTRPLGELPAYPEFLWDWLDEAPASEGMARFRVAERQRMDDYVARRAGGGMYA